jgi:hypothetical protein
MPRRVTDSRSKWQTRPRCPQIQLNHLIIRLDKIGVSAQSAPRAPSEPCATPPPGQVANATRPDVRTPQSCAHRRASVPAVRASFFFVPRAPVSHGPTSSQSVVPRTMPFHQGHQGINGGAAGGVAASLDSAMQHALSCLVIQHGHCIVDIVEQVRGQPANDPRPNKALCPDRLGHLLVGYQHCDLICQIAQEGVTPQWQVQQFRRGQDPENHQSTTRHLQSVLRSICRGQDAGQYLVLDDTILDIWRDVHVSH